MAGVAHSAQHPYSVITHCLEQLGLQTCGKEREDPKVRIRVTKFDNDYVHDLYHVEVATLFGLAIREKLDRDDPDLFEDELDYVLRQYGPFVWPKTGEGLRDHLREPDERTQYPKHLIYPENSVQLKEGLRGLIKGKSHRPDQKIDRLIDDESIVMAFRRSQRATSRSATKRSHPESSTTEARKMTRNNNEHAKSSDSEHLDDNIETETLHQTRSKRKHAPETSREVELRLYQVINQTKSPRHSPIHAYGSIYLEDYDITSDRCFFRICEHIQTDCSFMVFRLPEDMSQKSHVRIVRGAREAEHIFKDVLSILKKAKRYPDEPQHRYVEVEVGLEMPFED